VWLVILNHHMDKTKHGGIRLRQHLAFVAICCVGLVIRLWNYRIGGFGSEYYSAAVLSMGRNAHNFFLDSFDPAGFVTVDKPPLALWIQELSTQIFGFSGFSILLPQAIEGVMSVGLVYMWAARRLSQRVAVLAAAVLALNPVSVAADRSSNMESALTLLLMICVYCFDRALETRRLRYFLLSMVAVGLAFNTKFLAGWLIAPILFVLYFLKSSVPLTTRIAHGAAAATVLLAVSLAWVTAFDLHSPADRPHVAKTESNSMMELAFGTYGAQIVSGRGSAVNPLPAANSARRRSVFFDDVEPGVARLLDRHLAGQTSWFLPFVATTVAMILGLRGLSNGIRWSLAAYAGWATVYAAAFAYDHGTFHGYYLATIGPPVAILAAVGIDRVCNPLRERERWLLGLWALAAAWQIYVESQAGDHFQWIIATILIGAICALLGGFASARLAITGSALGIASLLVAPTVWALSSVIVPRVNTLTPSADILRLAGVPRDVLELASSGYGVATDDPKLFTFLQQQARGETYLLATPNARLAAPIIIHTGKAVMAMGGFSGEDRIVSPNQLRSMVAAHQVRYILLGDDLAFGTRPEDRERAQQFLSLAKEIGQPVSRPFWRTPRMPFAALLQTDQPLRLQGARMQLYDLNPDDDDRAQQTGSR
jgi:4-amino-4-deoxy-L-arabinose transferase-like glycosyltransferase